jgi:hypothetical protein
MRLAGSILTAVLLATPATVIAQSSIGEFRLQVVAGPALRPAHVQAPTDFPPPAGRALVGVAGSLSFVHHGLSVGPEAMLLRGSDRRMYALGGVARLGLTKGAIRPYFLVGFGAYAWDRKMVQPFDPASGAIWTADKTYLSGNGGGGLIIGGPPLALVLELRAHKSLAHDDLFGSRDLLSVSAGGRVSW